MSSPVGPAGGGPARGAGLGRVAGRLAAVVGTLVMALAYVAVSQPALDGANPDGPIHIAQVGMAVGAALLVGGFGMRWGRRWGVVLTAVAFVALLGLALGFAAALNTPG